MAKITQILLFEQLEQPALIMTETLPMHKIGDFIMNSTDELLKYLAEHGETATDVPFVLYSDWKKMYTEEVKVGVGLLLARPVPGKGKIESFTVAPGKNVASFYRGGYKDMDIVYKEMEKWAEQQGVEITPDCVEFYYNGSEFEEEDFLTKVYFPVKMK